MKRYFLIVIHALIVAACSPAGLCPCETTQVYESYKPCETLTVCAEQWGQQSNFEHKFNVVDCAVNFLNSNQLCKALMTEYTDCLKKRNCDSMQCQVKAYSLREHCGQLDKFKEPIYPVE